MTRTAAAARAPTEFGPAVSERVRVFVDVVAALPEVRKEVEANHDDNRWWPLNIADPRLRMAVAGWSTRVSYTMVATYAKVVAAADQVGFDTLTTMSDADLVGLLHPLGLPVARVTYLRSLTGFLHTVNADGHDIATIDLDALIGRFAREVNQASFKVAQCAVLYARGYHCGIIPVDSGMVEHLAPSLGLILPAGPAAHEHMRVLLQRCVADRPRDYQVIAARNDHQVALPEQTPPTWWVHLVLIYAKRLLFNRTDSRLCQRRPLCDAVMDCTHTNT